MLHRVYFDAKRKVNRFCYLGNVHNPTLTLLLFLTLTLPSSAAVEAVVRSHRICSFLDGQESATCNAA